MSKRHLIALGIVLFPAAAIATSEICGNGIDDNTNGMTDEGCAPSITTGVCESPLSCGLTGMISWSTGALHYDLPPDINPSVPYGPNIGFKRFYTSMFSPGTNPTSVNKNPLGSGWQHTYLTYLNAFGSGGTNYVTLHTSDGRDVLYTYSNTTSGWNYYAPQYTDHVMSLKQNTASPYQFQVQLLTGETLVYNSSGQITQIEDTEPTPNVVNITWDSTTNGNVSTVTDASGERRLLFTYVNGLMRTMQYQLLVSSTWTTEHTTTYEYASNVTMDATSFWYTPANATEWTNLLAGTGIASPQHLYSFQQASGNVSDSIGSTTFVASGPGSSSLSYQQAVTGWSRYGIKWTDNLGAYFSSSQSTNNTSAAMLVLAIMDSTPAASRTAFYQGARADLTSTPIFQVENNSWASGSDNPTGKVRPYLVSNSQYHQVTAMTDDQEQIQPTWGNVNNGTEIGGFVNGAPAMHVLYAAQWVGGSASAAGSGDFSDAQASQLVNLIENGTGQLASVTIGSQLAQQYTYGSGYLTNIADGAGNLIASYAYSTTTPGQVNLVTTPHGIAGLEYSSSRSSCSGETLLYFNALENPANDEKLACGSDGDCLSGEGFCGGRTSSSGSGICFLAGRCLNTSTSGNESVVTNVWPVGPGGSGSSNCTGACADVMQYQWTTPSSMFPVIGVSGLEDGMTNFTASTFNNNALPTTIYYGATNGSGSSANRVEYLFYDTTFPGRVAEVRRQSDLSTSTCSSTVTTGCDRVQYSFDGSNQLYQVTHTGFTYNSSGSAVSTTSTTTYSHDSKARVTEMYPLRKPRLVSVRRVAHRLVHDGGEHEYRDVDPAGRSVARERDQRRDIQPTRGLRGEHVAMVVVEAQA